MFARQILLVACLLGLACLVACQSGSGSTTTMTLQLETSDPDLQQRAVEVVRSRLERSGVRGLDVIPEGSNRIVVTFADEGDAARLGDLVCSTATLEFRIVRPLEEWQPVLEKLDAVGRATDPEAEPLTALIVPSATPQPVMSVPAPHLDRVRAIIADPRVQHAVRSGVVLLSREPENSSASEPSHGLYVLEDRPVLTGRDIESADQSPDPNRPGIWQINIELTRAGAQKFAKATGANVGRHLAICLDRGVVSAPRINSAIPGGQAVIAGTFTQEEASDLALLLDSDELPAAIEVVNVHVN